MNESELKAACIAAGIEITGRLVRDPPMATDGYFVRIDGAPILEIPAIAMPAIVMARLLAQAPHPVVFKAEPSGWFCRVGNVEEIWHGGTGLDHATAFWRAFKAAREAR